MNFNSRRLVILALLAASLVLLGFGLFQPVLTIRGVLKPEGVARMAPELLEKGLDDSTIDTLKSMMSPAILNLLKPSDADLRKMIIAKIAPEIAKAVQSNMGEIEVFNQTRSIVNSVRHLYEVNSPFPATLILLFSIVVPLTKALLVLVALFVPNVARRQRILAFVELIAKWSMADVFVVALFITYLAAQATQGASGSPSSLVAFTAEFGAGFYWFTGYCLFSLATQQFAARWLAEATV